jgi:hypothetical protein
MAEWKKRGKKTDEVVYFPFEDEKTLASANEVYVWDLDKTYLDTQFQTMRGLWRTAVEKAAQKKNIPGTVELVTSLKESWTNRWPQDPFPIFFITASPPQLEARIARKLEIDGVRPFGIFCKDNLANLHPRRFWRLSKHVGYKLHALLQMRSYLGDNVDLILFGDDGESDAIIYSLFSDICARRSNTEEIRKTLSFYSVLDDQIDTLLRFQDLFKPHDPVKKIYINLAEDTDSDYYLKFGRRCLPTYTSFQAALDLTQDKRLEIPHLIAIGRSLIQKFGYSPEQLDKSFDDLIRRERLTDDTVSLLVPRLIEAGLLTEEFTPTVLPKTREQIDGSFDPWVPERIEYLRDYR